MQSNARHLDRLSSQLCAAIRQNVTGGARSVPEAGRELWAIFTALSDARSFHKFGPNPISFSEISAWANLMQVPLKPWHVATLRAMDTEWLKAFYDRQGATREGVKTLPPRSSQPLTAALFDAALG